MGMFTMLVAILAVAPVPLVTEAIAEMQAPPSAGQKPSRPGAQTPTQGEEQEVEGQVRSIDPSGTAITLTDGTRLVTPPGAAIKPGALTEGATVIASYREENGQKVMTELVVKEPAASPPTEPRSSPGGPPAAPPSDSPKRY